MTTVDPWAPTTHVHTVRADMRRIRTELAETMTAQQSAHWERKEYTDHLGTAPKHAFQDGFWAGVQTILDLQHAIDDLTQGQFLAELRKEDGSIFWPLLSESKRIPAECPRCDWRGAIDREGICPECQHEFEEVD